MSGNAAEVLTKPGFRKTAMKIATSRHSGMRLLARARNDDFLFHHQPE